MAVATTTNKTKELLAALAKSRDAFNEKYKYKVAGQEDALFSKIAKTVKDEQVVSTLKRTRVKAYGTLAALTADSAAASSARLEFARHSIRALRNVSATAPAKDVAGSISELSKEILDLTKDYAFDTANQDDAEAFKSAVRRMLDQLDGLILDQAPRLRAVKVFFSIDIYKAQQRIAEARAALVSPVVNPTPSEGGADGDGDGMNIVV